LLRQLVKEGAFVEKPGGIILAGGQSRRMGTDKALLRLTPDSPRLIELAVNTLAPLTASIIISANTPDKYAWLNLPVVPDNFPGCGPLAGLEATLSITPTTWNFALACDMPQVQPSLLSYLWERAQTSSVVAVVPLDRAGLPQPLCAIYNQAALPYIRTQLKSGNFKLRTWLETAPVLWLKAQELLSFDSTLASFRNLNTPDDACN
jgi:molybdenum cofactor guanylyltransferase